MVAILLSESVAKGGVEKLTPNQYERLARL